MIRTCALLLVTALPAAAQDWSAQVTPYVWGVGLGGDITPFTGAPGISFDKSISEVIEDSDGAFFLSGLVRRERVVFMGDLSWSSSSRAGRVGPGFPAEGKLTQRSITLLGGWRVVTNDELTLDALAGARAWSIDGSVTSVLRASVSKDFVDPIVALRANFALAPQWSAILYADVGGFGVGSENTSQILATVNYQASERLWLSVGYRQLAVDYRSGGTDLDVIVAGPLLGATWRF
ncbi:porin family protein [Falsirhodobacter xinxiangensis]|uniref:porin family protein n=1 Tax=Falsirhodobacter xinxiangensis TaxID=2530049 RepID=UPI0010AA10BE|nr:porin family protein [Rhodobacter xinxiangensis]